MIQDIRLSVGFVGHRKRLKLTMLLGPGATDHLIDLWIRTAIDRPDGVLHGWDDLDIGLAAGWRGDPKTFREALQVAGFLDQLHDGTFALHDWADHQAWVIGSNARSDKAKKAASARWTRGQDEAETLAEAVGDAGPAAPKRPEVGPKTGFTMLQACSEHTSSMPVACAEHARSNAPLLSSSSPKITPPVRDKSLTSPPGGEAVYTKAFLTWWEAYPVKVKKPRAWKAWKAIKGVNALTLINAVRAQEAAGHHEYKDGPKWPHPSTWLNDRRWEDEIKAAAAAGSGLDAWAQDGTSKQEDSRNDEA